jgi:hypothetical protein
MLVVNACKQNDRIRNEEEIRRIWEKLFNCICILRIIGILFI